MKCVPRRSLCQAGLAEPSAARSSRTDCAPYVSEINTCEPRMTGEEALTDSYVRERCLKVKSILPLAGSRESSPPVGGRDSPPAKTKTRRLPKTVAGIGEA